MNAGGNTRKESKPKKSNLLAMAPPSTSTSSCAPVTIEMDSTSLLRPSRSSGCLSRPSPSVALNICLFASLGFTVLLLARCSQAATPPLPVVAVGESDQTRALCNDHGIWTDGACDCFDCWLGEECTLRQADMSAECVVMANSGTPYLFERYWVEHAPAAALHIEASYHIGYGDAVPRLEAAIRAVHALVGNAVTQGRHLIVGIGSTELISAAMFALSTDTNGSALAEPALAWSQTPFYSGYMNPMVYQSRAFEFDPRAALPSPSSSRRVVELVTSPNNPDGHLRTPTVTPGAGAKVVMDHAYLWPHFVGMDATSGVPVDYGDDVLSLFTLSKLTGHASTRVGWAVTSCPKVAAKLKHFLRMATFGAPRESQLRAALALEHVVSTDGAIFTYARRLMLSRWMRLEALFGRHAAAAKASGDGGGGGFRLEARDAAAAVDAYSGESGYEPSPAYAWVQRLDGGDALASLESVGVVGRSGAEFGAGTNFVRIELLMREQTFEILLIKLTAMLGLEGAGGD
jgi:histidinol-phosphate/aromatic aminotransferase/cobyric acid decarboxylase-like protein